MATTTVSTTGIMVGTAGTDPAGTCSPACVHKLECCFPDRMCGLSPNIRIPTALAIAALVGSPLLLVELPYSLLTGCPLHGLPVPQARSARRTLSVLRVLRQHPGHASGALQVSDQWRGMPLMSTRCVHQTTASTHELPSWFLCPRSRPAALFLNATSGTHAACMGWTTRTAHCTSARGSAAAADSAPLTNSGWAMHCPVLSCCLARHLIT